MLQSGNIILLSLESLLRKGCIAIIKVILITTIIILRKFVNTMIAEVNSTSAIARIITAIMTTTKKMIVMNAD